MLLTALCHRRSTALNVAAAADKIGLEWRSLQTDPVRFQERIAIEQPRFALVTNENLGDPALFTTIRSTSPDTILIICLTAGGFPDKNLWNVLDTLEFDVPCTLEELPDCLLTLKAGRFYQSSLLKMHSGYQLQEPLPGWHDLTPAERRILALMADDKTGPQIADILYISTKTVNNHKAKISQKLNVSGGPGSLTRFVLLQREQLLALLT